MQTAHKVTDTQMLAWDFDTLLKHVPIGRTKLNELVLMGKIRCSWAGNKRIFDPETARQDFLNLRRE